LWSVQRAQTPFAIVHGDDANAIATLDDCLGVGAAAFDVDVPRANGKAARLVVMNDGAVAFANDGAIAFADEGPIAFMRLLAFLPHLRHAARRCLAVAAHE